MNNKISLQDLAQGLAKRKGMSRRDAESFIHKVFEVIEERVMAEGAVKVKGLGTFKINTVDSRESVNVATGERFVIDTHSRISFTPHPKLRDAVNRPFSDFETVAISDDVKTEDMEFIPPADKPVEDVSAPLEAVSESAVKPEPAPEPIAEESAPDLEPEPVEEPASAAQSEPAVEPAVEQPEPVVEPAVEQPEPAVEPSPAPEEPAPQSKSSSKTAIIIGVLAVVVLCVLFFVFWHPNKPLEESVTVTEQTTAAQEESTIEEASAPEVVELTDEEAAEKYPQVENGEYLIVGTKEEYTLQKGDDLFKLSVGVYGDKKFAPYIVVYNDIKNPSHIEIGDVLKLPELRKKE